MAQMNPNFEIDFSDINSYEQIQLINDTQLAKENLLMHRAYKEPSDDEIIRNHFSSFTFIDFCPKLFTAKTSGVRDQRQQQLGEPEHKQTLRHYELETFTDLFERINAWLKLNKNWRVVSMETLVYDCTSQFNHIKSSIYSNYLPQNTRGLRLFLSPSKSRFSGPQRIGCINVVPRKILGSHLKPDEPVVYETLDEILHRLNELLLTRPIEGRILSVETITLPMVNGYVNTESNYFMDSRLNLLNQHTYNIKNVATATAMTATNTLNPIPSESGQYFYDSGTLRAHNLMDILRVYYEFGPMVCGLVNLIDFVPRFYASTVIGGSPDSTASLNPSQPPNEIAQPISSDNTSSHSNETTSMNAPLTTGQKIPSTESLTRLIRRSLAWFESERKQVLSDTQSAHKRDHSDSSISSQTKQINLKVCNLQVHHKTLLKSQLVQINQSNALASVSTRTMAHQSVTYMKPPLACSQCSISTAINPSQDWCAHIADLSQVYQVKFVRLAYVVPVYNKYARPVNSLRHLRIGYNRKAKQSDQANDSQPGLSSQHANSSLILDDDSSTSTSSPDSSSSISSECSQQSTPTCSPSPDKKIPSSLLINSDGEQQQLVESTQGKLLTNQSQSISITENEATKEAGIDAKNNEEYTKQAALEIVNRTNLRHKIDEEAHQKGLSDDGLNDSHIGQLTYRLFAPCQLVNSSSCFSINPVNSSSPLARRGSVDLNGSGISSENAHPSTSLLGPTSSSSNQYSEAQQIVTSFGAFFPALSHDMVAVSSDAISKAQTSGGGGGGGGGSSSSSSRFTTNEFEPVEAIRRRMEVYVTTNSMKVIAGETLIVNLSDILSCLSTAIEQTIVPASFSPQSAATTWVNVYVLYAAVEEPQLPGQLLAQQKLRELALIEESLDEEAAQSSCSKKLDNIFDDDFEGTITPTTTSTTTTNTTATTPTTTTTVTTTTKSAHNTEQPMPSTSAIRIEQNSADSTLTLYNSAYDRTVALPTQPENHLDNLDPIDFLGSDTDCLWLNEADLLEAQLKKHQRVDHKRSARKKPKARRTGKGRHEDSQCSIM